MKTLRKVTIGMFAIGLGLAISAHDASAQGAGPFDHYKCYRIKDEAKFKAKVDLYAFQTQFNVDPLCQVKGRGKLFCVPVQKTVDTLVYPSGSTMGPISMPGQDLLEDRICYKVKCPINGQIANEEVEDQFGRRKIGAFKVSMLCTNAIKTSSVSTTTTTTTSTTSTTMPGGNICEMDPATGICGGPCPNPTDICMTFPGGCDCVPAPPCQMDPQTGVCGGSCPDPHEVCMTFPGGCDCVIPCQADPLTGQCGGQCPAGQICDVDTAGNCNCQ